MSLPHHVVAISRPGISYPQDAPFAGANPVRDMVEQLFLRMHLDRNNPLGELVHPGGRIVIKPNFVASRNRHESIDGAALLASSTHGSVLRAVVDYALHAVGPHGRVDILDAPIEGCDVEAVMRQLGVSAVLSNYKQREKPVRMIDLRTFRVVPQMLLDDVRYNDRSYNIGLLVRKPLPGDPLGYRIVDLGSASYFARSDAPAPSQLRFHRSHYRTPIVHHEHGKHEYSIPNSLLQADLVINIPKMKTHKKTGVTLSLKSVIGLTNEKYWLPHFTEGDPSVGGDEFDRKQTFSERIEHKFSRFPLPWGHSAIVRAPRIHSTNGVIDGSWDGNDTLWRTILDLNRILFFADQKGNLQSQQQRKYLTIVDGIVAGEGEGPLGSEPVQTGLLFGGTHPALVDAAVAQTMGFSVDQIVHIDRALKEKIFSEHAFCDLCLDWEGPPLSYSFKPPQSWPRLK